MDVTSKLSTKLSDRQWRTSHIRRRMKSCGKYYKDQIWLYKLAAQACQASIEIYPHVSAAWVCCDAYMELEMYEEALSMLSSHSDDGLPFSAKKEVTLLRRLENRETLSKFRRELEREPWFNK